MNFNRLQVIGLCMILLGVMLPFLTESALPTKTIAVFSGSGSASDIQAAVHAVATSGGGDVCIPAGTFNFVEVGESWQTVNVPAGVNLFGAPTERDANGQVIEWKTIIQIPAEFAPPRPSYITMFKFEGTGNPDKPSRVSDIKFVGYRDFEPTSDRWYSAIQMWNVIDFRIDHCFIKHITHQAINVRAPADGDCCGVIDHCKFINDYGYVEWNYAECTVGYGVSIRAIGTMRWEDDISKVIGHYNPYTVFVEDCYFSRWRHCVCSNDGTHYVFRHNVIEKDSIVGSLDAHGGAYGNVGTRAMEIYDNQIIDPVLNKHPENWDSMTPSNPTNGLQGYCINWRGGDGVVFNNIMRNYEVGVYMIDEGPIEKCWPHDVYIWNNTFTQLRRNTLTYSDYRTITEGVDYFFHEPDTFDYQPYPHPHPLTLSGSSPNDGGKLEVTAYYDDEPIVANVTVTASNGIIYSSQTPYTADLQPGQYEVSVMSSYGTESETVTITSTQTTKLLITWSSTEEPETDIEEPSGALKWIPLQLIFILFGAILFYKGRKK